MANNPKKLTDPTDETPYGHPAGPERIRRAHRRRRCGARGSGDAAAADEPIHHYKPAQQDEPAQHYEPTRSYEAPRANLHPEQDLFEDTAPAHDDVRPSQYAGQRRAPVDRANPAAPCSSARPRPPTSWRRVFALAWAACGVALAFLYLPDLQSVLKQGSGRHPGHGRSCRLRAGADRILLRDGLPDVALAGDAPDRPVDGRASRCGLPSRKRSPAIPWSPSARRSAARSRRWATASSARSRAPPSSKPWSPTKCRRSSAPTTTTKSASAACSKRWRISATPWSARPNRCATPSPACISICRTTFPRSANTSQRRSTTAPSGSPRPSPRRASTSRSRSAAPAIP